MSLISVFLSIAPIFAVIILGHFLRRKGVPNTEFWNFNDKLVYEGKPERRLTTMIKTWEEREDPGLVFPAEIKVTTNVK